MKTAIDEIRAMGEVHGVGMRANVLALFIFALAVTSVTTSTLLFTRSHSLDPTDLSAVTDDVAEVKRAQELNYQRFLTLGSRLGGIDIRLNNFDARQNLFDLRTAPAAKQEGATKCP